MTDFDIKKTFMRTNNNIREQKTNALLITNLPSNYSISNFRFFFQNLSKNGFLGISNFEKKGIIVYFTTEIEANLVQKALELLLFNGQSLISTFYKNENNKIDYPIFPIFQQNLKYSIPKNDILPTKFNQMSSEQIIKISKNRFK